MNSMTITEEERTWAILAHLSALLSVLSLFVLGPVAAFTIWLIKKERSPYVGFQALQSFVYQIASAAVNWVMWVIIWTLSAFIIGCVCVPVGLLISLATVAYPMYAAYRCSQGENFRYFLIADLLSPKPTAPSTTPPMPPAQMLPSTPPAEPPAPPADQPPAMS